MIHLIIKGNVAQATQAAHDRGISLNQTCSNERAMPVSAYNVGETSARCASDYRMRVIAWFAEAPIHAPFPAGTLLLFTEGHKP